MIKGIGRAGRQIQLNNEYGCWTCEETLGNPVRNEGMGQHCAKNEISDIRKKEYEFVKYGFWILLWKYSLLNGALRLGQNLFRSFS
jgi:hypothetical protein